MNEQIELAIASSSGDYHAAVEALDAGADPNWIDQSNGNSPVLNACKMGHAHIVQLLCSRGLDPNTRFTWRSAVDKSRHKNKTPLMFARHADVVETLVAAGADPNQTDDDGITPLMIACQSGKLDLVKMLLDHGAMVDAENNMGATAIDIVYHRTKELSGLRRAENADTVDSRLTELSNITALLDEHAACE
ncbi:ankyrin repeat-containing protein [Rhodopirellula sallentina SM41]|uniref:Ankyrin repeat-containing protein n=2 Tax=Rhodopirellula TaxID=265488 RepID=M5U3Y9_9BACT|nr:ankyrin repeat-containing protein [Rhodopirellula sallentina SM41]